MPGSSSQRSRSRWRRRLLSNDGVAAFLDSTGAIASFTWGYLGHEMAHYYFGTVLIGRGPYTWFLRESIAEYRALQTVRRFQGDPAFRARIATYAQTARDDSTSVLFDRITAEAELHDRYRYELGPLLLVAMEDAIGADRVRRLLATLVRHPKRIWDYAAIREAARATGVSAETWTTFEARCIRPRFASGCLAGYAK